MSRNISLPQVDLSTMKIDEPCPMAWEALKPIDGQPIARFCDRCQLKVTNLSDMTASQASVFLMSPGEVGGHARQCVTYIVSPSGGPRTLDYRRPAPRRWRAGWRAAMLLGSIGATFAAGTRYVLAKAGVVPAPAPVIRMAGTPTVSMVMGDIAPPTPSTQPTSQPATQPAAQDAAPDVFITGKPSISPAK